jgi:hypothetical protein
MRGEGVGGFAPSGIRLPTPRDAVPFGKNLASKFVNEKPTAVYRPHTTDSAALNGKGRYQRGFFIAALYTDLTQTERASP